MPRPSVLLALGVAGAASRAYKCEEEAGGGALPFAMQDFAKHAVGIGGGSLLCVMAVFWMAEREFRKDLKLLLLGGAKEKHD